MLILQTLHLRSCEATAIVDEEESTDEIKEDSVVQKSVEGIDEEESQRSSQQIPHLHE